MAFVRNLGLLAVAVAVSLVAGCTSVPPPTSDSSPAGIPLASYSQCRVQDPDGRELACRDDARLAEVAASPGPTWLCIDHAQSGTTVVRLLETPQGGVGLDFRGPSGADGMAWWNTSGQTNILRWAGSTKGFVQLQGAPARGLLYVAFYKKTIHSSSAQLAGATLSTLWSAEWSQPISIDVVKANSLVAYFPGSVAIQGPGGISMGPTGYNVEGADFSLEVTLDQYVPILFDHGTSPNAC